MSSTRLPAPPWSAVLVLTGALLTLTSGVLVAVNPPRSSSPAGAGPAGVASPAWMVTPEDFGAVGDGVADDTVALQEALDSLGRGQALVLDRGRVYRHTAVLLARQPGSRIVGQGELLATDEAQSSLQLQADDIQVHGIVLSVVRTTKRWEGLDQHRLVLGRHRGLRVSEVKVTRSAAAGIFVDGARGFTIEDVAVSDTRADGIHLTGGAEDGVVLRPVVSRSGDDAVAVVSYRSDPGVSRRISVLSPRVRTTTGGRGVSVVGGEDIVYRDVHVEGSAAAGIYLATEGAPYFTRNTLRVQVVGGRLIGANTDASIDHGALLVSAAGESSLVRDVSVSGVTIRGTRSDASAQVGVLAYDDADAWDVMFTGIRVEGGGSALRTTAPKGRVRTSGWIVDGVRTDDPLDLP